MNRLMLMTVAGLLLAAGEAASAAEKETAINWPARAATVKVGMTRAEVEKILPRWSPDCGIQKLYIKTDTKKRSAFLEGIDPCREFHRTNLGTNTLILTKPVYDGGCYASLGSRGPGWMTEYYHVSEDWLVTVTYDDRNSKGVKGFSAENRVVGPVKIEKLK